jgi:hypothetical protein
MSVNKHFQGYLSAGLNSLNDSHEYQVWYEGEREIFKGYGIVLKEMKWAAGAEGWISFACAVGWSPKLVILQKADR